jgi:hypothetical protein
VRRRLPVAAADERDPERDAEGDEDGAAHAVEFRVAGAQFVAVLDDAGGDQEGDPRSGADGRDVEACRLGRSGPWEPKRRG